MSGWPEPPVVEMLKIPLNHPLIGAYLAGEMTDEELIEAIHIDTCCEEIAAHIEAMFPPSIAETLRP